MPGTYRENMHFEAEARWIAEAVWNLRSGTCQPAHYPNDPVVREVDGIARLRDVTHLIMVTTSTKLDKAKSDVKKLNAAEAIERKKAVAVSKWLITQSQLDAQHIEYAHKHNVTVLTLEQFKQRFLDGRSYIAKREVSSFGSARNPLDNSITISDDAYVPLPMAVIEHVSVKGLKSNRYEEQRRPTDIAGLANLLQKGSIIVLLAPFGAGKSVTTRELFKYLAQDYRNLPGPTVPICLNLREHWGQEYFDEMLERHARSIAFTPREDLVAAWRAGMANILFDGFDEVASQTIVRKDDINFMMESRRVALTGVRDFMTKLPSGTGAFICGRDHYFDNNREMEHALGLNGKNYKLIKLDEFTEDATNQFLKKNGIDTHLPDWLPRKPLILSYLIQKNLLSEILEIDASEGYGYAWDSFITKITERESELERAVMDAHTLRRVMERLAFSVRSLTSGNGPITGNDLANTYSIETGQPAGEGVLAQLQRLPGLTQRDQEAGARSFVDADMLFALQGGAIARIISGQFDTLDKIPLQALSEPAINMAAYLLKKDGATSTTPMATVQRLSREPRTQTTAQVTADCFSVALAMAKEDDGILDGHGTTIDSATLGVLDIEECDLKNVRFTDCLISEVLVNQRLVDSGITFQNCIITRVGGISGASSLPETVFSKSCEVQKFDDISTNNAVLQLDIEPQVKALITILRKLYRQSGAGRKVSALNRGITRKEVESYIPQVLDLLEQLEFVRLFNNVVHPVRKKANRVEAILNAPSLSQDDLLLAVRAL